MFWLLLSTAVVLTLVLTGIVRFYALRNSMIDIPNYRSSHKVPTPRGGGIAIVVSFIFSVLVLGYLQLIPRELMFSLLGSGGLVAIIGFFDDLGHIAARWRLLAHFSAASWALYWLGGLPDIQVAGFSLEFELLRNFFAALFLVWMLNLFNFMDGIDGIAGLEVITVCAGAAVLYYTIGMENRVFLSILLAACTVGFLFWNFPPAKIFMGDAGSGFLGLVLGLLTINAAWDHQSLFWGWLILLGVFIVDATVTLLRRLARGEKIYEAHRSHAYQNASRQYGSHKVVTLCVGAINIIWLLPCALAVVLQIWPAWLGLSVGYVPLIILALKYKAGAPESGGAT